METKIGKLIPHNDALYRSVDTRFKSIWGREYKLRLAMASKRRLYVDENVEALVPYLKHYFSKIKQPIPGTTDEDIIKEISGKGYILITANYDDFRHDQYGNFDVIWVPHHAGSAMAEQWAKYIWRQVGAIHDSKMGFTVQRLSKLPSKSQLSKKLPKKL